LDDQFQSWELLDDAGRDLRPFADQDQEIGFGQLPVCKKRSANDRNTLF
jgi:hypothetical protein